MDCESVFLSIRGGIGANVASAAARVRVKSVRASRVDRFRPRGQKIDNQLSRTLMLVHYFS
jgi:hypothetical protein